MIGKDQRQLDAPLPRPRPDSHPPRGEAIDRIGKPARPTVGHGAGRGDDDLSGEGVLGARRGRRGQRSKLDAMRLVERVQPFQRPVDEDGLLPSSLAQQFDHPLRLAQGVGPDDVAALGELLDRGQKAPDLTRVVRMAEHRQAEGRLGDEDVTGYRLEPRAGRVTAALVVAGDHHGQALPAHHRLGGTQHVAGGDQGHLDAIVGERLAIGRGLALAGEVLSVAGRHDRQGLGRGGHGAMARAGVVGVAMGDHGPVHGADRVDVEVSRRAVEAVRSGTEKVFRLDHGWI